MTSGFRVWIQHVLIAVAQRMAYRGEYVISLVCMSAFELTGPLFLFIVYANSEGFSGWSFYEALLVQGLFLLVKGFSTSVFFGIVWHANMILREGGFDMVLLSPRNPLFMFICRSFDAEDVAKFFTGVILTFYALGKIPDVGLMSVLRLFTLVIFGIAFMFSLALFFSSFIFRVTKTWRVYEIFDVINLVGLYPKSVYPSFAGTFFTAVIPVFIVAAFPVEALRSGFTLEMLISALSASVLLLLGLKLWFVTIKSYASAGG